MGDGGLVEFASAVAGGDVIIDGHDLCGEGVSLAAPKEGLADADGLCILDDVHRQAAGKTGAGFADLGA